VRTKLRATTATDNDRGIDDVEQRHRWAGGCASTTDSPNRAKITGKGDQHQGGDEPQQDCRLVDAQANDECPGLALKKGELAANTAKTCPAGREAPVSRHREGPAHERQTCSSSRKGAAFATQGMGWRWRWWYGTKPRP